MTFPCCSSQRKRIHFLLSVESSSPTWPGGNLIFLSNKQSSLQTDFFACAILPILPVRINSEFDNCSKDALTTQLTPTRLHHTVFFSNLTSRSNKEGQRQRLLLSSLFNSSISFLRAGVQLPIRNRPVKTMDSVLLSTAL